MSPADTAEVEQWTRAARRLLADRRRRGSYPPPYIEVGERMLELLQQRAWELNDNLGSDLAAKGFEADLIFQRVPLVPIMLKTDPGPFVRTIVERKLDSGPRLVYADWLEEHGDERGEFIRVQCEAADLLRQCEKDPSNEDLVKRRFTAVGRGNELLTPANKKDWSRPLGDAFYCEFDRGFVGGITGTWSHFLAGRHVILSVHPIRWVNLTSAPTLHTFYNALTHSLYLWLEGLEEKFFTINTWRRGERMRPASMRVILALLRVNFPGIRFGGYSLERPPVREVGHPPAQDRPARVDEEIEHGPQQSGRESQAAAEASEATSAAT